MNFGQFLFDHHSYPKAIEREQRIHTETPVQKKSFSFHHIISLLSNLSSFDSVRGIHSFRRYSALAVVLVSALFVSLHNIELRRANNAFLPFNYEEDQTKPNVFDFASERYPEISSLPYVRSMNLETEKEESLAEIIPTPKDGIEKHLYIQSLIATANAMEKDPDEDGGVTLYTIKEGDTLSSIAQKHNITVNTILWANTIEDEDSVRPGDELFILPVAGIKHIIKEGETLKKIAEEYKAQEDQIIAFNNLPANGAIESGLEIIIPEGQKELPKKEVLTPLFEKRTYISNEANEGSKTVIKRHDKPNSFPYGYCTWYVAQKKYIPWRGNAGAWLYNAKAMGYKTGKTPQTGSIVVTTDNTYYGHVAIVEKVSGDTITVSEMNYVKWGKSNTRSLSIKDRKIRGYIY